MRATHIVMAWAFAASLGVAATAAEAQDSIYVPLLTYRTGPFAGSGIPIANGLHDYLTMLDERDGGVGGVKLNVDECETGYDTKKGVECYEAVKGKSPVIMNPWSTGITLQLIPKASVDKIPILSLGYGLSAAAVGDDFPWIFNPPATYWDGLSMIFKYIGSKAGGLDKLRGKTIGYIGAREDGPSPHDLMLLPVGSAAASNLTALSLDRQIFNFEWMPDDSLLTVAADGFHTIFAELDAKGGLSRPQLTGTPVNPSAFIASTTQSRACCKATPGGNLPAKIRR